MVAGYTCRSCRTIACQQLYETGTLSLGGSVIISGALPNSIVTNVNLAGSTTVHERCSGILEI